MYQQALLEQLPLKTRIILQSTAVRGSTLDCFANGICSKPAVNRQPPFRRWELMLVQHNLRSILRLAAMLLMISTLARISRKSYKNDTFQAWQRAVNRQPASHANNSWSRSATILSIFRKKCQFSKFLPKMSTLGNHYSR